MLAEIALIQPTADARRTSIRTFDQPDCSKALKMALLVTLPALNDILESSFELRVSVKTE